MATIVYSISSKVDKVLGLNEVLVRFFHGKINQRGKTRIFVPKESWDQDNQRNRIPKIRVMTEEKKEQVKDLEIKNGKLKELSQLIMTRFLEAGGGKKELPSDWLTTVIAEFYNDPSESEEEAIDEKETMLDVFHRYIEREHNMAESQRVQHRVIHRALHRFTLYTGTSIEFEDFTVETLRKLEDFLLHEHEFISYDDKKKEYYINNKKYESVYKQVPECRFPKQRGKNTVIKLMSRLRTFMRWAKKEHYIDNYPFEDYEMGTALYGTPYFLTKEERNLLYHTEYPNRPDLAVQRDIFVFQCFIGCRVGDFMKMTKDNIINGAIEYIPRKTKEGRPVTVRVPISPTAQEILDRYPDVPGNRLLPFICEQDYNRCIKDMIRLAGIDRNVTVINTITREEEKKPIWKVASSHMARRVLVGNLYRELKDPNLIAKISGHVENSRAFNRYRDIDEEMAKEVILKLE